MGGFERVKDLNNFFYREGFGDGRDGTGRGSVQPETVDIIIGKVSSPASKSRRIGGKVQK
jgi:hypothetical protein